MAEDLEKLLESEFLEVPGDFPRRLMRRIDALPLPVHRSRSWEVLRWLALTGGGVLAIAQLAGFMFGIWTAVTAT